MRIKWTYAVRRGIWHEEHGLPCGDFVHVLEKDGNVFAALADAAGSIPGSERAANAAVHVVTHLLCEKGDAVFTAPDEELYTDLISEAAVGVSWLTGGLPADCTLLFAAVGKDGKYLAGHLGDGAILLLEDGKEGSVLSFPENGDKAGSTYFVSGPDPKKHLRLYRGELQGPSGLILTSDGLARLLYYENSGKTVPACGMMMQWMEKLESGTVREKLELELEELFSRETQDDMSLALLRCEPVL